MGRNLTHQAKPSKEYCILWSSPQWRKCTPRVGQAQVWILAAKAPRILTGSLKLSGEVLNKNHTLLLQFWGFTKNHALLSWFYIRRFKNSRNILPQKEILETFCHRKKFPVSGRNFLWWEGISCQRKKFPVTGRNFLLKDDLSLH